MAAGDSGSAADIREDTGAAEALPVARIDRVAGGNAARGLFSRMWLVAVACLLLSVGFVIRNQKPAGVPIRIYFEQGHGLKAGNSLQHRGIDVGQVSAIRLTDDGTGVVVDAQLMPDAASLARDGTQFWIVRPQVSLSRVTGLETVVGARYIEVQPGPPGRPSQWEFQGLESPLSVADARAVDILIRFSDGHGLTAGDQVRHRGIAVGEVVAVDLADDLSGVLVRVRLAHSALSLAREGTRFWIERPTVSVTEVRGLDTLVRGRFIAVAPAAAGTGPQREFDGLDTPPPGEMPEGGLEIVLESRQRGGLERGVPVLYRGFRVGHVSSVAISSDAATVEARVWIDAAYRHLIREETKFWTDSGVDIRFGLQGVEVSTRSVASFLSGSVSLATPPDAGPVAASGRRFFCEEEPQEEWLDWAPQLPLGEMAARVQELVPRVVRVRLEWSERSFGFRRSRSRSGLALPLRDGRLLGLSRLLTPVADSLDGQTTLACEGVSLELAPEHVTVHGPLAAVTGFELPGRSDRQPGIQQLQAVSDPVDVLLVTPGLTGQFGIAASRFTVVDGRWVVDPSVPLTSSHDGAPVVARDSGAVIGFLSLDDAGAAVVPVTGFMEDRR